MRLLLLHTQSPRTGWQVPREHWQGEEQFTPKYPSGQVSLQLEERGKEGKCPWGEWGPSPDPLPALPGSPVARLADASSCHGVTAPHNALGAEELASITEGACGAGDVAAAKTESEASAPLHRAAGTPARARSWAYLGPIQPGSQCRQDPVSGSQTSPCQQRGHGWRQSSPWKPGVQGSLQRVPFQPGWQARQKPSTGEQGWLCLQLPQLCGQSGDEVLRPTLSPPPPKCRLHPTPVFSIGLGHREIVLRHCRSDRAGGKQGEMLL